MSVSQQPLPVTYPVMQIPTSIDYTSRDYMSLLASMTAYAAQIFPQWNTSSQGDMGVMLMELWAYAGDIMSYYGDRISQEAYLPTATQRNSLLNIAQLLGYVVSNGAPASGFVTFITDPTAPDTTVPALTQVSTSVSVTESQLLGGSTQPAVYETQSDVIVPANGGTVQVEVVQGVTYTMVAIGTSDGTPGQEFSIPQLGVLDGSVSVYLQSAPSNQTAVVTTQWNQVQYIVDAGPQDTSYALSTDSAGATHVEFGDNITGLVPPVGMNVYASYRIGMGAAGNVAAGLVANLVATISGVSIAKLSDNTTPNTTAMTGGSDPESNDSIRANAPGAYRAQYRAVGLEDFSDLALQVPGVLMSTAVANHSTSVSLYVLGPNYSPPGPVLVDNILDYFEDKTLVGVSLSVLSPDIIPIDIGSVSNPITIQCLPGFGQAGVLNNVTAALQSFLSPPAQSFGQLINASDIFNTIDAVAGVDFTILPVFTREDVTQTGTASIQLRATEVANYGNFYITMTGGI